MTTAAKPASRVPVKRPSKHLEVIETSQKPFLRFYHSQKLRDKTIAVLNMIESAEVATDHSGQLIELVIEMTDSGMDQFFLQSMKVAKVNFVVLKSAGLGLASVQKVMGTVVRTIIGRMDDHQLRSVCASIRQFMV